MRIWFLVLAVAALLAGCGGGEDESPTKGVDLTDLVGILPTPKGLDQASSFIRSASAAAVQEALARQASPDSAREFEKRGFVDGAIRTWTGAGGAEFVVVLSRWGDHMTAVAVGAGAAELPSGTPGTSAWNPREISGARGSRTEAPGAPSRSLSFAVADVSVFARADGPVSDDAVVRTVDLAIRPLLAGTRE